MAHQHISSTCYHLVFQKDLRVRTPKLHTCSFKGNATPFREEERETLFRESRWFGTCITRKTPVFSRTLFQFIGFIHSLMALRYFHCFLGAGSHRAVELGVICILVAPHAKSPDDLLQWLRDVKKDGTPEALHSLMARVPRRCFPISPPGTC